MMRPVTFRWEPRAPGSTELAMIPIERYHTIAKRQFFDGQEYTLEHVAARNMKAHNAYFAEVAEIWENLPEAVNTIIHPETGEIVARWPTEEHLRKWALVEAGYSKKKYYVCDNRKRALELAAIIRDIDEYCVMRISDTTLEIYEPRSQSIQPPPHGMRAEEFMESKRKVLDICRALIPGWSTTDWRRSEKPPRG